MPTAGSRRGTCRRISTQLESATCFTLTDSSTVTARKRTCPVSAKPCRSQTSRSRRSKGSQSDTKICAPSRRNFSEATAPPIAAYLTPHPHHETRHPSPHVHQSYPTAPHKPQIQPQVLWPQWSHHREVSSASHSQFFAGPVGFTSPASSLSHETPTTLNSHMICGPRGGLSGKNDGDGWSWRRWNRGGAVMGDNE